MWERSPDRDILVEVGPAPGWTGASAMMQVEPTEVAVRVRYRILESHFDVKAYLHSIPEAGAAAAKAYDEGPAFFQTPRGRGEAASGAELTRAVAGLADTPRAVESHDGEAELSEVKEMVRRGELHLRDLVDVGRGWESVDRCGELFDVAIVAEDEARSVRRTGRVIAVMLVAAAVISWLALR